MIKKRLLLILCCISQLSFGNHLNRIELVLEYLAKVVNNENIHLDNRASLRNSIYSRKEFVGKLKSSSYNTDKIISALIVDITQSIEEGLKFPEFDETKILSNQDDSDIEKKLEKLEKLSHEAGLKQINKSFRRIEQLSAKYELKRNLGRLCASLAVAGYLYNRFSHTEKVSNRIVGTVGSMFALTPSLVLAEFIKENCKNSSAEIKRYISNQKKLILNYLRGNKLDTDPRISLPRKDLSFISGQEQAKRIANLLVEYVKNQAVFNQSGIELPLKYFISGSDDKDKAYFTGAIANELSFKLFKLSAGDILKDGIESISRDIARIAPCVVFLSDIESLNFNDDKFLNAFIKTMNGTNPTKKVLFFISINDKTSVNSKLQKDGKFGPTMFIYNPSLSDRKKTLERLSKDYCLDVSKFNFETLAQETKNFSNSSLSNLVKQACNIAQITNETVSQSHFEAAIDQSRGIIPGGLPEYEQKIVAAHIAGAILINNSYGRKIARATILPVVKSDSIDFGEVFPYEDRDSLDIMCTENDSLIFAKILLSGFAAEKILLGSIDYHYNKAAYEKAFQVIKNSVFRSLDEKLLPEQVKSEMVHTVLETLDKCLSEVENSLNKEKSKLEKLFSTLRTENTLNYNQINELI